MKIPRSEAERTNATLFRKYFNKQPVASFPVPIHHNGAEYKANLSIYEEDDIYLQFGPFSQWFSFPEREMTQQRGITFNLSPISSAQASWFDIKGIARAIKNADGSVTNYVVDPRTGNIIKQSDIPTLAPSTSILPVAPIDVDYLKTVVNVYPSQTAASNVCMAAGSSCLIATPMSPASPCRCLDSAGNMHAGEVQ